MLKMLKIFILKVYQLIYFYVMVHRIICGKWWMVIFYELSNVHFVWGWGGLCDVCLENIQYGDIAHANDRYA